VGINGGSPRQENKEITCLFEYEKTTGIPGIIGRIKKQSLKLLIVYSCCW
jgi:hypothetical protein